MADTASPLGLVLYKPNSTDCQAMSKTYMHVSIKTVTLSGKINHLVLFMKSEIITPPESPSIADHSGTLIFLIGLTILELWAFKCGQYAGLFNLKRV